MVTCARCGANIEPSAPVCPFCGIQTQFGQQQAERQAAYQYHQAQQAQAQQVAEQQSRKLLLTKKSQHAMLWSLGGLFVCCFPLALIGLVMGLNVKSAAKREGFPAPTTSTVAVVLGVCALFAFVGIVALYIHDSRETDARIATLKAQLGNAADKELLEQPTACALVELHVLQEGYSESAGINFQNFQCNGKLELHGERATLREVRLNTSSKHYEAAGCFVRGVRWSLKELRADGSCEIVPASASASASVAAPASPASAR